MEQQRSDAGRVTAKAQKASLEKLNAVKSGAKIEGSRQRAAGDGRTRILFIEGQCMVRRLLTALAAREPSLGTWFQADNAVRALEIIENSGINLVVVDISPACRACMRLIEKIRLQCPQLPLLTISEKEPSADSSGLSSPQTPAATVSLEAIDRVIAGINYAQSLLASRVGGFTLVVRT
jgi:DNA-binding NarL/FixJ family response regulator